MGEIGALGKLIAACGDALLANGIAPGGIGQFGIEGIAQLAGEAVGFSGAALIDQNDIALTVEVAENCQRFARKIGGCLTWPACKEKNGVWFLDARGRRQDNYIERDFAALARCPILDYVQGGALHFAFHVRNAAGTEWQGGGLAGSCVVAASAEQERRSDSSHCGNNENFVHHEIGLRGNCVCRTLFPTSGKIKSNATKSRYLRSTPL